MKKNAFTLFELLITISIIGILTAVAVVSFSSAQKKGRDARRMQDMKSIQTAAEQYYSQNSSSYPATNDLLVAGAGGQKVLEVFPIDPKNVAPNQYASVWTLGTSYCICARLENAAGNSSDATCANFVASGGAFYCVKNQQ